MGKYDIKKPKTSLMDYDITIYGEAGAGKTSFMNVLYNKPLFLAFEKGQKALEHRSVYIPDWRTFKKEAKELIKLKKEHQLDFDVIVFDSSDSATTACKRYVCDTNGWDEPEKTQWLYVKTEYETEINKLQEAGFKIGRIAHAKTVKIKPQFGEEYDEIQPNIGATFQADVIEKPDFLIYFRYKKEMDLVNQTSKIIREMVLESDCTCKAKGRGNMPSVISCGNSPEEAVANFKKAFVESFESDNVDTDTTFKKETINEKERINGKKELQNEDELNKLIEQITEKGKQLLKDKKITAIEIKELNEQINGVSKVNEIKNCNQAKKLLEEMCKL